MDYLLGVDGGGTNTRAVLLTERGRVLGTGHAASSNYHNVGEETAARHIRLACDAAFRQAGIKPLPVRAAFLGLAGVKAAGDISRMKAAAEAVRVALPGNITVANDLHNALSGGLAGSPGIALVAGTGSNCLGRDSSGKTWMCGGWGWFLDDAGSALGLSAAALRMTARAADRRGASTTLLPAALAFFGLSEPNGLLERLYTGTWNPALIAEFAPVVIRHAREGDACAQKVLEEGASALAELVATSARQLSFEKEIPVILLGSCARSGPPYQTLLQQAIVRACRKARIQEPRHDALHGAAINVLRSLRPDSSACLKFPKEKNKPIESSSHA